MIAISDVKKRKIPNQMLVILCVIAIILGFVTTDITWADRIVGSLIVSCSLLFLTFLYPRAFGAGDVKLMAVSGLLLGWQKNLVAFCVAVLLAGTYSFYLICKKVDGHKEVIAFGPFLCIGIEAAMLFGEQMIQWYIG